jgi:hypothetical protein
VSFDLASDNDYQDKTLLVRFDVNAIQQKNVPLKPES